MVKCLKCNATLPDFATMCQFCGSPMSLPGVGQGQSGNRVRQAVNSNSWVRPAYYAVAGYWVFSGALECLTAKGSALSIVFGAINILVGLGLILKIEVVRSIVNFICFLNILGGLFGLVMMFFSPFVGGLFGVFMVLLQFFNLGTSGLMIFLIGETESQGPNF